MLQLVSIKNTPPKRCAYPGNTEISTYTIRNSDIRHLCEKLIAQIEHDKEQHPSFVQDFHLDNTSTIAAPPTSAIKHVLVVGSINIDHYICRAAATSYRGYGIHQIGGAIPRGKGVIRRSAQPSSGTALPLSAMSASTMGSIYIFKAMEQHGVNTAGVRRCAGEDTGSSVIFTCPQRRIGHRDSLRSQRVAHPG